MIHLFPREHLDVFFLCSLGNVLYKYPNMQLRPLQCGGRPKDINQTSPLLVKEDRRVKRLLWLLGQGSNIHISK